MEKYDAKEFITVQKGITMLTDIFVRDKITGKIHRVGDDPHDSIWVDMYGTVHYYKLNMGDGCGANSIENESYGFEFCPSDNGYINENYYLEHENDFENYMKERMKQDEIE